MADVDEALPAEGMDVLGQAAAPRGRQVRLFIWPAFGTEKKPGYGKLIGQVAFVVKR